MSAEERRMWTTWVRERAVSALPPEKLLPDRQPAYVSSWIYVFGVAHDRGAGRRRRLRA